MLSFDEFERGGRANGTQGGLSLKPSCVSPSPSGVWRALDEDSSGEVSIDEFMHFMRQTDKKEVKEEKKKTSSHRGARKGQGARRFSKEAQEARNSRGRPRSGARAAQFEKDAGAAEARGKSPIAI